jgi:hypothetical protein
MAEMEQLVDDVGLGQAPGVEDRRPLGSVVGGDPDQAVADAAVLVADREGGDPLERHFVGVEAETASPLGEEVVGILIRASPDNDSHYNPGPDASETEGTNRCPAAR